MNPKTLKLMLRYDFLETQMARTQRCIERSRQGAVTSARERAIDAASDESILADEIIDEIFRDERREKTRL